MAVPHGSQAALLVDGYSLSGFARSAQASPSITLHDSTVFGNVAHAKLPGLKTGVLSAEMFFDDTVDVGSWDVLKTKYVNQTPGAVAPAIISLFPQGFVLGSRAVIMSANLNKLESKSIIDDLVKLSLGAESEQDGIDFGFSLHALAAETGTVNGTSLDNAAATANGGVGTLHVTAITGAAPSVVVTLQHSVDDSTWVTLVTFVASTAANTAQRIEIAAGTTVRRYMRAVTTFGGTTSSITFQTSFSRR